MTEPHESPVTVREQSNLLWLLPILFAWALYMVVGLYPELFYTVLRHIGGVVTQNALVNSPHFVTVALAAYFGWFVYQRCVESHMPGLHAKARGIQFMVVSSLAFLNFNPAWVLWAHQLPNSGSRIALIGIITAKLGAWFYLCLLLFRYYIIGQVSVFSEMPEQRYVAAEADQPQPRHSHENNGRAAAPSTPPALTQTDHRDTGEGGEASAPR